MKILVAIITYEATGLPRWLSGEESAFNAGDAKKLTFDPCVAKSPWSRKWQPTPFLPGESRGQKSLVGYSSWSRKELDMTECARAHTHTHTHTGYHRNPLAPQGKRRANEPQGLLVRFMGQRLDTLDVGVYERGCLHGVDKL